MQGEMVLISRACFCLGIYAACFLWPICKSPYQGAVSSESDMKSEFTGFSLYSIRIRPLFYMDFFSRWIYSLLSSLFELLNKTLKNPKKSKIFLISREDARFNLPKYLTTFIFWVIILFALIF